MQNFRVVTPELETSCVRCGRGFVTQEILLYRFTFPADRFCDVCKEAEKADGVEKRAQVLLAQAQIPREFSSASFDNFVPAQGTRHALDRARAWSHEFNSGRPVSRGLLFYGPPGTGKTHLAVSVIKTAISRRDVRCLFLNVPEWLNAIREAWNTDDGEPPPNPAGYQIVVIDDLGAENATAWARERIYGLLNHRVQQRLLTIVTSNLSVTELRERLGRPTASRLRQLCAEVPVEGNDQRIAAADEPAA